MELIIEGRPVTALPGESLLELIKRLGLDSSSLSARPLAADIAGEIFSLNFVPGNKEGSPAFVIGYRERKALRDAGGRVSLIRYASSRGRRIYERTMLFVFFLAVRRLFPEAKVTVNYALGAGLSVSFAGIPSLSEKNILRLKEECLALIREDFPLERKRLDVEEAIEHFASDGQDDKVRMLSWREFTYFDVYKKEDYADYLYGELAPSSGYVSVFDLIPAEDGVLLLRPDSSCPDRPAPYTPMPRFTAVFRESRDWGRLMECETVPDLNDCVQSGRIRELIRVNEALHEKKFAGLAADIVSRGAKAVFIAGPSSSGKTTSANRLCTQLRVQGKKPTLISLDDYYLDRDLIPPEPDGSIDLEHIRTIDLARFGEDLTALLNGGEVELPTFDFTAQKSRPSGRRVKVSEDAPIVIEGIHGLNPALLPPGLDKDKIYKLFVSALTTLRLDNHNRIPTTDMRLLRRLVRDYMTRGASVERTLGMWASVQQGEQRWIFPYQETADAIFNTTLVYELCVLKEHIFPILQQVGASSPCYDQVRSIIKFLNYVRPASVDDEIPPTGILREFIGGNSFYRK